jgi:MoaA/NifB/PqqE/SkfB family radical SAM enzyme
MTVLMEENRRDLERLLQQSAARGVGHNITLLATQGTRRARGGSWPAGGVSDELQRLWTRYPHFRSFRDYLAALDPFLAGGPMPTCRAGLQSFNIDHLGNVSPCIEKIDEPVGNVRQEPLKVLLERLRGALGVDTCQECFTLCRGMGQLLGDRGTPRAWVDFSTRLRSR